MTHSKTVAWFAPLLIAVCLCAGSAFATDISGTIATTLTITDNSRLMGDVTCTVSGAPCIALGAPGITLDLNGFSITGLADSQTGCNGGPTTAVLAVPDEDGINATAQTSGTTPAPRLVRQFRGAGVLPLKRPWDTRTGTNAPHPFP